MAKNNKLFDLVPEAKAYYDFDKNKSIDVSALTIGSKIPVYWKCPDCGIETLQKINAKVRRQPDGSYTFKGCRHNNKRLLFDLVPEAIAYYNFEKNKDIDAATLSVGSDKRVWWKCPDCGAETFQQINLKARKLPDGSYRFYDCKCRHYTRQSKNGAQQTVSDIECLSKIWDAKNNSALDPASIHIKSRVRANWVCLKCGHTWCDPVYRTYNASGRCPACEGQNFIVPGCNDVMTLTPDAKLYYDWNKNVGIDIEHLGVSSNTEVYWRCPNCGNETKAAIKNKIHKQSDGSYRVSSCNRCFGKSREKQAGDTSTAKYVSESENLMKFWDKDSNEGLNPATLSIYSRKEVSWKCQKCGHTWTSKIHHLCRASGKCPSCDKHYVSENENLMRFWDKNGNKGLDPATLSIFSRKEASWKCRKCGYTWTSKINNLRKSKGECPCCDRHRVVVAGVNDVFTLVPDAKDYYDFEKNEDIDITTVNISSKQPVWWKCPTCGNETCSSFASKIKNIGGTYYFGTCRKSHRGIANMQGEKAVKSSTDIGIHSLAARFPVLAHLWSDNNERSATSVSPDAIFNALWICPDCHFEYRALVHDMVNGNASCPICSNKRIQPGYNTLSDKNPDIAKLWSSNNRLRPIDVFPTSSFTARWLCPACGGEYDAPVRDMVGGIVECPYCAGRRPLSGFNTLADKYPTFAAMWSTENGRHADSVLPNSAYVALWDCPECGGKYNGKRQLRRRIEASPIL